MEGTARVSNNGSRGPLRVLFYTTAAHPFAKANELSEFTGKAAKSLANVGIETSLMTIMFKQTREELEKQGRLGDLESLDPSGMPFSYKNTEYRAYVKKLALAPNLTYYFIEHGDLFGNRPQMYEYIDDVDRFSSAAEIAIKTAQLAGLRYDLVDAADWQGADLIVRLKTEENEFFKGTGTILGIHAIAYNFDRVILGIMQADRCYVRNWNQFTDFLAKGDLGGYGYYLRTMARKHKIIPVFQNEMCDPINEETVEYARNRLIGFYRKVLPGRRFGDSVMELAPQDGVWEGALTPSETFRVKGLCDIYAKLSKEDREIVQAEFDAGRGQRFSNCTSEEDIQKIINFLKIKPECNFEERVGGEELISSLFDLFCPRDLDRLLSAKFDLGNCGDSRIIDEFGQEGEITFYQALECLGVVDHVINHFVHLNKRVALAQFQEPGQIVKIWDEVKKKGIPKEKMAEIVNEAKFASAIYNGIKDNQEDFKLFVLATVLHDIGKCLNHDMHPDRGYEIVMRMRDVLEGLIGKEKTEMLADVVLYHSKFADVVVTAEAHPTALLNIYSRYGSSESKRNLLFDILYLLGISDMSAASVITPSKMRNMRNLHGLLITASNQKELKDFIENYRVYKKLNLSDKRFKDKRWREFILGDKEDSLLHDAQMSRLLRQIKAELLKYLKRAKSVELDKKGVKRKGKEREKVEQGGFKTFLGSIEYMWCVRNVLHEIPDIKLRVAFLFKLCKYFEHLKDNNYPRQRGFILSVSEEEKEKLGKGIISGLGHQIDEKTEMLVIYLKK